MALFYLKVSAAALARFALVRVVDEGARRAVEDEPALVPRAEARAHLVQVAPRRRRRQRHVAAQLHLRHHKKKRFFVWLKKTNKRKTTEVHLVAGRLHVLPQVETVAADRQVARQRTLLLSVGEETNKKELDLRHPNALRESVEREGAAKKKRNSKRNEMAKVRRRPRKSSPWLIWQYSFFSVVLSFAMATVAIREALASRFLAVALVRL